MSAPKSHEEPENRVRYQLQSNDSYTTSPITIATMNDAITAYNRTHEVKLRHPPKLINNPEQWRQFVEHYIVFVDAQNRVIKRAHGSGMDGVSEEEASMGSSDGELPTTAPVAPYNDVRNDPYLVMR